MIKHIVCFKLKDNSVENCEKAKEVLLSMKGNVPLIRDIAVGVDFLHSERSYDVILEVVLDDAKALEDYQKMEIEAFKNGDYDDITLAYTLKDPYFYKGLITPAAAILISSFSVDSISLKQRKRR